MKTLIDIEKDNIIESFNYLQMYLSGMLISPEKSFFDERIQKMMVDFFRSSDPNELNNIRKMMKTAIIQSCNDNKNIFEFKKAAVANRSTIEFLTILDTAREKYQSLMGIGKYEGLDRIKANKVFESESRKKNIIKRAEGSRRYKRMVKTLGERNIKSEIIDIGTGTTLLGKLYRWATMLVPADIKEDFRKDMNSLKEWGKKTTEKILHSCETTLNKTAIGAKIVDVIKKGKDKFVEINDAVREYRKKVIDKGKKVWTKIKSLFA